MLLLLEAGTLLRCPVIARGPVGAPVGVVIVPLRFGSVGTRGPVMARGPVGAPVGVVNELPNLGSVAL